MPALKLKVTGRVQGVFFRATAKEVADGLGLAGWVKNTPDGGVQAHLEGSLDDINRFIDWVHIGPEAANVATVEQLETDLEGYSGFQIIF